jgi:hypothetical protein
MIYVQVVVSSAGSIAQTWEAYYADRSLPVPNVVEYVAEYGYARLMVHGWTELPIEVLPDQIEAWQEHGLGTTFNEFFEINISGLAGGFMLLAVKDPAFTSSTIRAQLLEKYARLAELTSKPLEWFTPREFTEEEIDEGKDWSEWKRIGEVFDIYEHLTCFSYAMPILTAFAITEEDEEFGLPNKELYEELEKIDLNTVLKHLFEYEDRVRAIRRFLGECRYLPDRDTAHESFWWRHWEREMKKSKPPRQQRSRPPRK